MFGTFIHDEYNFDNVEQLRTSIEDITCSDDTWGWASCGIYFFRSITTGEIFYIGLARDLTSRFSQHNGLIKVRPDGCKYEFIKEYLKTNDKIGLTIFAQSPLEQPSIASNKGADFLLLEPEGISRIKFTEGYFIKLHQNLYGSIPIWNKMQGDKGGQKLANDSVGPYLLKSVIPTMGGPFNSKHTITELAKNQNAALVTDEVDMHAIRMMALNFPGCTLPIAIQLFRKSHELSEEKYQRLLSKGYFDFLK